MDFTIHPTGEPPNPLLIHTVIKEVSHYLSTPDLKVCRLVCRNWDEELSKILRKVAHVPLPSDRRIEEFFQAAIMNHPFCSNYHLGPDVTLNLRDGSGGLAYKFLSIYGPFIKSLFLNNCKWTSDDLRHILYHFCPNLEELCVIGSGGEEGLFLQGIEEEARRELKYIKCLRVNLSCTRMIRNTKLMADLLRVTPNVETISWIETYMDEVRYDRNFQLDLERAWCARPQENGVTIRDTIYDTAIHHREIALRKLSRIESNMRLNNDSLKVLELRGFPLKFLDITLTLDVEPGVIFSLLTSLSKTLITLKLEFFPFQGSTKFYGFNFPKLGKLEHLFLQKFSPDSAPFSSRFGSDKFPRLKSLTFCETDFKFMVENNEISEGCRGGGGRERLRRNESIRILQVTCDLSRYPLTNELAIVRLADFAPNLREVRMENFDRMDRSFWECSFPRLKVFGHPSEKGLDGLPCPTTRGENECSKCCKHLVQGQYQR